MIRFHKDAEKFILSQGKKSAMRIYAAIEKLPLGDVKKLQGKRPPALFRLRVGSYRIIFHVEQDIYTILRVDNRVDVYK